MFWIIVRTTEQKSMLSLSKIRELMILGMNISLVELEIYPMHSRIELVIILQFFMMMIFYMIIS